jgi:hypothetical protein
MKPLVNDLTLAVFGKDLLRKRMSVGKFLRLLDQKNLLDIGELAEQAKSKTAGVALCKKHTKGIDTENGVQIKHVKTWTEPKVTGIRAHVSPRNSQGPLAITVTETITDKQWYFWIPLNDAQQANSIKFTFNSDGSPRRGKGRCDAYLPDWWNYNVDNYQELCKLIAKHKS